MIVLTLPYPISANRYWTSRAVSVNGRLMPITHPTSEAQAYRKDVARACWAAGVKAPLLGRLEVTISLYPQRPKDFATRMRKLGAAWDDDVRCIDLDNANKVLLDALKGIAIEDDKWVRRLSSERMEPDGEARVVMRIAQLLVEQPQADLLGAAA